MRLATEMTGFILLFATGLALFGIFFAIVGFGLWYFKVQRYQDRILRAQSAAVLNRGKTPIRRLRPAPAL